MADSGKIKLVIRQSNGEQFEVEVEPTATVLQLKEACVESGKLGTEQQRLIFKGRILKDEQTLESYKIEGGVTVHLVKAKATGDAPATATQPTGAQPTAAAQANPFAGMGGMGGFPGMGGMGGMPGGLGGLGGMGGFPGMGGMGGMGGMPPGGLNPQMISEMMGNPMVQQMLSNPAFMENMISQNPMLSQMVNSNPQMRAILTNPAMMQQMMTPENLQAAMGMMGGQGGMGGGFPGMGGFGGMGGMGMPPMDPAMMAQMQAMMGGSGAPSTATADARPPSEKYATELAQIKEMGFNNDELILQMLVQCNGNVNLALERLFAALN